MLQGYARWQKNGPQTAQLAKMHNKRPTKLYKTEKRKNLLTNKLENNMIITDETGFINKKS